MIYQGRIIPKPWGEEEVWAEADSYAAKVLRVRAGHRLSLQHHDKKVETMRVLSGTMEIEIGTTPRTLEVARLGPGDCIHIEPNTVHRVKAVTDLAVLEVSTTELGDVVRHADDYGRI